MDVISEQQDHNFSFISMEEVTRMQDHNFVVATLEKIGDATLSQSKNTTLFQQNHSPPLTPVPPIPLPGVSFIFSVDGPKIQLEFPKWPNSTSAEMIDMSGCSFMGGLKLDRSFSKWPDGQVYAKWMIDGKRDLSLIHI